MKGVNTMSFEAFNEDEIKIILDHTIEQMKKTDLKDQIKKHGSIEKYRATLAEGLQNEKVMTDLIKWYGSKEKAMEAVLQSNGQSEALSQKQDENERIYKLFMQAKATNNPHLAKESVLLLSENYKKLFCLDNARNILLDLAKEYLQKDKLAEATDEKYGTGCAEFIGNAIQKFYGV